MDGWMDGWMDVRSQIGSSDWSPAVRVEVSAAQVADSAGGLVKRVKVKADGPLPSEAEVKKALKKAQQAKIPWCVSCL